MVGISSVQSKASANLEASKALHTINLSRPTDWSGVSTVGGESFQYSPCAGITYSIAQKAAKSGPPQFSLTISQGAPDIKHAIQMTRPLYNTVSSLHRSIKEVKDSMRLALVDAIKSGTVAAGTDSASRYEWKNKGQSMEGVIFKASLQHESELPIRVSADLQRVPDPKSTEAWRIDFSATSKLGQVCMSNSIKLTEAQGKLMYDALLKKLAE